MLADTSSHRFEQAKQSKRGGGGGGGGGDDDDDDDDDERDLEVGIRSFFVGGRRSRGAPRFTRAAKRGRRGLEGSGANFLSLTRNPGTAPHQPSGASCWATARYSSL